ncbi:hypothetical protein AgCh_034101 [Apium graveolens]
MLFPTGSNKSMIMIPKAANLEGAAKKVEGQTVLCRDCITRKAGKKSIIFSSKSSMEQLLIMTKEQNMK